MWSTSYSLFTESHSLVLRNSEGLERKQFKEGVCGGGHGNCGVWSLKIGGILREPWSFHTGLAREQLPRGLRAGAECARVIGAPLPGGVWGLVWSRTRAGRAWRSPLRWQRPDHGRVEDGRKWTGYRENMNAGLRDVEEKGEQD